MKNSFPFISVKCAALGLALLINFVALANPATNAVAGTNAPVKIKPPALIQSVFINDPLQGRDPFFPTSTRRTEGLQQVAAVKTEPLPNDLFHKLVLKGITTGRGQTLAIINGSTMGVGERAEIRCGERAVKIVCREIRDRSVVIELDGFGEVKELHLRDGI